MEVETTINRIKNGDIEAIGLVYELFYESAFRSAFIITCDVGLAEDAVHQAFLNLQSKIYQLRDPSKMEAWLCRSITNLARDIIRERFKSTTTTGIDTSNQWTCPETVLLNDEKKQIIKQQILRLPPDFKIIIYLRYYKQMSINEISKYLKIPVGTVKSRLIRARKRIKKLYLKDRYNLKKSGVV